MRKTNGIVLALLVSGWASLHAQTAVLEFKFNDSGTTTTSTGSSSATATLLNSSNVATDFHSAAGLGVSGQSWDLAFDNTSATGMGSAGTGARASISPSPSAVQNFTSFTLQGWYKTDGVALGNSVRLVNLNTGTNGYYIIGSSGNLALMVNNTTVAPTTTAYGTVSTWTFFAVTYDGTSTSNNVNFYVGSTSSSVSLVQTLTLNKGTVGDASSVPFVIGSDNGPSRTLDGYMDDVRVFGSTSGTSGVLSLSDLENLRQIDITGVPEPSTYALLFMGGAGLWLTRRTAVRRRR